MNQFRFGVLLFAYMIAISAVAGAPLRVAYSYWFPAVPLAIAEQQHYWQKAGVEVELKAFATGQEVADALLKGEADVGYDMLGTWLDLAQQGKPIVILGETDWSNGGDKFMVRAGRKLADLKGHPLIIYQHTSAVLLFLREALKKEQLTISDFKIVEMSDEAKVKEAYLGGKLDLVLFFDPLAGQIVEAGATLLANTADFPGVMPEGFVARRDFATPANAATLQAFFAGWFQAVRYLHEPAHRAEIAKLASAVTFAGTSTVTVDDVVTYARTTPVHAADHALQRNDLQAGNLNDFITRIKVLWLQEGKALPATPLTAFFNLEPIRAAAAEASAAKMAAR